MTLRIPASDYDAFVSDLKSSKVFGGGVEVTDEDGYYAIGEYKHNQRHGIWYEEEPDGSKWDVKYEDDEVVWSYERKLELVPDK